MAVENCLLNIICVHVKYRSYIHSSIWKKMSFSYFKLFYLNIFYPLNYIFNAYYICFVRVIMIWVSVYMCLPLHMLLFNKYFRINL